MARDQRALARGDGSAKPGLRNARSEATKALPGLRTGAADRRRSMQATRCPTVATDVVGCAVGSRHRSGTIASDGINRCADRVGGRGTEGSQRARSRPLAGDLPGPAGDRRRGLALPLRGRRQHRPLRPAHHRSGGRAASSCASSSTCPNLAMRLGQLESDAGADRARPTRWRRASPWPPSRSGWRSSSRRRSTACWNCSGTGGPAICRPAIALVISNHDELARSWRPGASRSIASPSDPANKREAEERQQCAARRGRSTR